MARPLLHRVPWIPASIAAAVLALAPVAHGEGEPHPHPRVIVKVERLRGGHARAAVERSARLAWGRIVACHHAAKARGDKGKGTVEVRLEVSGAGKIIGARRLRADVDGELAGCVVRALRQLSMPTARHGSTADVSVWVAPGDGSAVPEE